MGNDEAAEQAAVAGEVADSDSLPDGAVDASDVENCAVADADDVADVAPAGEDDLATLRAALDEKQAALEAATAKVAAAEDSALRAKAEAENVRRRAGRDVDNARKFALEPFVRQLLPAIDSFERAVDAASGGVDAESNAAVANMAEGMQLSLKLLADVMAGQGIEIVDPVGAPFDPSLHEAMSMIENAEVEDRTVLEVFEKGYTLNGRLMRAARVIVSRLPPSTVAEAPAAGDAAASDAMQCAPAELDQDKTKST